MNPTIRDVAKLAGTSKSTVSRYLNGQAVKKRTQEALEAAIRELNFHPNVHARRLVTNQTNMIGVIVNDISNVFYSGILKGVETVAEANGYGCVYYSRTSGDRRESEFVKLLHEGQVDGLIFVSFKKRDAAEAEILQNADAPIVVIGDDGGNRALHSVDVDHEHGISELVHYLFALGHRKLGYISGPAEESPSVYRLEGFRKALAELGMETRKEWIAASDWTNEGGYKAMMTLLEAGGVTAVLSSNDEMAVGALTAMRDKNLTVPEDCSLVGYDDINIARWVYPPLTTVRQPFYEIGRLAAEGLLAKVRSDEAAEGARILLKPEIVIRESCRSLHPVTN
ncbi:LacI family transcriptional regulator [Cohnella pontilimi]|uniref:LacI family transcriptional regulator n=1 Tax=Cohnella pontilimi TaxID=2564100 RepID=A0A4U0FJC5_9BACL|nr:LacI family DNA-binding transcriptional regulator [Cohnella pontilimi]TJY43572.1 LacI family transcriptional regulator [Cohnella pontilimi]